MIVLVSNVNSFHYKPLQLVLVFFLFVSYFFPSDNAGVIVNPKGEMKGNVYLFFYFSKYYFYTNECFGQLRMQCSLGP